MTADTDQPTLAVQAHEWRKREVQAIGAAISTRSWHAVEQAYNSLRDKMDRAGCWWAPDTRITHEPRPAGELREAAQALKAMHEDEIAVLRKTLIKMGRMLPGVALHDEVSSSFLTNLPAELAAALAAHSPAPMAGWRSMNDAPKDGTQILAWFWSALVGNGYGWADTIRWWNGMWWNDRDGPCEPVAWMPRPAPPAAAHPSTQEGGK